MFSMKHHYYNYPKSRIKEVFNARNVIVGNNPVLNILKRNGYETYLLMSKSYLLLNRPNMAYDYCNVKSNEFTYFSRGFHVDKDTYGDLKKVMLNDTLTNKPKFYFIEELTPGHITNATNLGAIAKAQREKYLKKIEEANVWLKNMIDFIVAKDPNALVVITADHGGFVGMNTTAESKIKQTDVDLVQSIFASKLAIRWPDTMESPKDIKSSVNLFRILFSNLSEDQSLLNNLQSDKSYIQIDKGAPFGVYEYLDENGNLIFNKVEKQ